MPERFLRDGELDPNVPDPGRFAFGYGRRRVSEMHTYRICWLTFDLRICPGRYFAEGSLFINMAMVLHVFNITAPLDEAGKPIHIEPKMSNKLVS